MLIDTHAHLNFKAFKKNLDNVLWQAQVDDVEKIIVPGADLESSKKAVEMAKSYKNIYAAVGTHPHHSNIKYQISNIKKELEKLAKNNKVVAIGECGLDYYQYKKTKYKDYKVDENFKKIQKEIFGIHLELARELGLPVIIHNRQAHEDIKKVISLKFKGLKGVFHCFSGDEKFLQWILEKGFYIGFAGNVTYFRSSAFCGARKDGTPAPLRGGRHNKNLQHLVKLTPLDKILLETDSPFLTPEPLRSQKRAWRSFPNKPENVKIIAQFIAELKGDSFLKVAKQTTKNAKELFGF